MLDIKFIRDNPDLIQAAARRKHIAFDVKELLETDDRRRTLLTEVEELRAKQNTASDAVAAIEDASAKEAAIRDLRELKNALQNKERELEKIQTDWERLMFDVPNIPDPSVPDGESDRDNVEVHRWGEPAAFDFAPRDHMTLLAELDLADLERGVKVSGFRGYFLKNEAAALSLALWQFVFHLFRDKGYCPVFAPALVREPNLVGSGHFPQSREDVYKTQDDLYLAATAEIPMMGMFADEILAEAELPKKFLAFSPCFRREAGAAGKDAKGIYRLHEFFKIEQLIMSVADHQDSVRLHEELTANAESVLQALKLPYRVVVNSAGDIGRAHVKTYDIEVWIPSERRYRESHSSSYYHDFQARRLGIRYRDAGGAIRFCYSLNNTAIATPRILISILENYQQADGSVRIPEVLREIVGFDRIAPKA